MSSTNYYLYCISYSLAVVGHTNRPSSPVGNCLTTAQPPLRFAYFSGPRYHCNYNRSYVAPVCQR